MLEINNQDRGSGKTTKIIELMGQDKQALCLVPNFSIKRNSFPKELYSRVIVVTNIDFLIDDLKSRRFTKLYVDELLLSRFSIAKLFYELGQRRVYVVVYGTDK